eukprot:SAG31_NODE_9708_length_1239_cov_1.385088_1_plen_186_part_01
MRKPLLTDSEVQARELNAKSAQPKMGVFGAPALDVAENISQVERPISHRAVSAYALRYFFDTKVKMQPDHIYMEATKEAANVLRQGKPEYGILSLVGLSQQIAAKEDLLARAPSGQEMATAKMKAELRILKRDEKLRKADLESRNYLVPYMTSRDVIKFVIKRETATRDALCRYIELPGWAEQVDP